MSFLDESNGHADPTQSGHAPPEPKPKGRGAGSLVAKIKLANAFLDETYARLKPVQRDVWLILWRDERDGLARTAQQDIARRCGDRNENAIQRAITELVKLGLLVVVERGRVGKGPSSYQLHADIDPARARASTPRQRGAQPRASVPARARASAGYPSRDIQGDATDARRLEAAASVDVGAERGSQ